jgi:putative membrane protein
MEKNRRVAQTAPRAFVISVTTFGDDGVLDEPAFRAHLHRMACAGLGVYVVGSGSGEGYALTAQASPSRTQRVRSWLTWSVDNELANDRTFLAWLRTGIALFGLGFVVAKVALIVQPDATQLSNKDLYSTVGVLIVLSGAALVVVGYVQHARVLRSLDRDEEAARPRWPLTITVIACAGSLLLSVLIVVST